MYSFEPKRVDSAIRFTHLIIQEAKVCLRLLRIRNLQLFERRLGILLGSIHNHETDLEELVSYASDNVEKALISDLHNIAKGSNILLRLYRQYNTLAEHTQQAERFLRLLIALERRLDGLFKRFKKEIPEEGEVFFAGIDGGGTKTSAVVNDGTKNLGEEREGPCFPQKVGVGVAVNNIMRSLEGACSKSNLDFKATVFRRVAICAAGIQDRSEYVTLHNAISLYIRKAAPNIQDFILVPDFVAAWYAVFQGEHNQRDSGAIIIGGTGHAVYGRNGNRQHFILDFNQKFNFREFSALSGNIVTLRAAEVLLRQIRKNQFDDYSYHSPLRDEVRKAFASGNLWSRHRNMTLRQLLIDLVRNSERTNQPQILSVPELGAMAPYFVKAARKGDADAIHILENASNNTAILVARVVNAIGLQRQPFEIGIIGSFFFSIKEERIIKKDLAVFAPYATVRREKVETENGLTLMAHRNDRRYEVK